MPRGDESIRPQGFDVVFMGKAHVFPYDIATYKMNRYVVDPLWRGVTVGAVGALAAFCSARDDSDAALRGKVEHVAS